MIQSAFLWGYTATQLLGGSLADKYGGRAVIAVGAHMVTLPLLQLPLIELMLAFCLQTAAAGPHTGSQAGRA